MSDTPEMAAWKRKHGITDNPAEPVNQEHMMIREMKLITRRDNPYVQFDESDSDYIAEEYRVRMCPECHAKRIAGGRNECAIPSQLSGCRPVVPNDHEEHTDSLHAKPVWPMALLLGHQRLQIRVLHARSIEAQLLEKRAYPWGGEANW